LTNGGHALQNEGNGVGGRRTTSEIDDWPSICLRDSPAHMTLRPPSPVGYKHANKWSSLVLIQLLLLLLLESIPFPSFLLAWHAVNSWKSRLHAWRVLRKDSFPFPSFHHPSVPTTTKHATGIINGSLSLSQLDSISMVFAVDSGGSQLWLISNRFSIGRACGLGLFGYLHLTNWLLVNSAITCIYIHIFKYLMGLGIWMVDICRNRGNYSKGSIFGGEVKASRYWFWVSVLVMLCKLISCLLLPRPTPFHTHMYAGCVWWID